MSELDFMRLRRDVARRLGIDVEGVSADWSDNGEDDWQLPVYVTIGFSYGLCDMAADDWDAQVNFLVEQLGG